jgi:hypothetical protein
VHCKPYEHLVQPIKNNFPINSNVKTILQYVENEHRETPIFVRSHIQQANFEHEYNPFYFHLLTFPVVIWAMVQMEYLLMMFENFSDLDFDEIPVERGDQFI